MRRIQKKFTKYEINLHFNSHWNLITNWFRKNFRYIITLQNGNPSVVRRPEFILCSCCSLFKCKRLTFRSVVYIIQIVEMRKLVINSIQVHRPLSVIWTRSFLRISQFSNTSQSNKIKNYAKLGSVFSYDWMKCNKEYCKGQFYQRIVPREGS